MISRDFGAAGGSAYNHEPTAPPPLHVYNPLEGSEWWPVRPVLAATPAGPVMIHIPVVAPYGDDPLDPTMCTEPRVASAGMIGWLNARAGLGVRTVAGQGVRT